MNDVCRMIKKQTITNYINMETAIKTYDRNASVCGTPAWRYVYHAIHSAAIKTYDNGMDNPDNPCNVVLSDTELLDYLHKVQIKTENYLDNLSDEELNEKPDGCEYTRLELILGQFRHISSHIGMINGQTIERTGRFPVFSGLDGKQTDKLYDE